MATEQDIINKGLKLISDHIDFLRKLGLKAKTGKPAVSMIRIARYAIK